ncbi:hemolysin family protein [Clostridium botulinum]|uniref:HlyC/CorC family transporter n=1 Tax=Clostridium botulinum TaxID=1491 RepID=A0A6B4SBF5_CLOBO|nr:hemolysin family protein [Clostridium botulinum]EES47720.1 putative membrane CBS domain protein [Clostridium botulinum E1 str. 'BoNT E Beluga']MBY6762652.1 HlyC/CorC family transporter [Clostridium botulinum]MBY6921437.1 HlyC/CorC family transporter [Clostridium botulinum]MCR1132331.1 hemolysin family protein [Clostridium botulinum]NFE74593.1 HlyC/CorC family transporter [Clostridium botulinum]
MDPSYTWEIVTLVILLMLSGFFSMSETALMSLNKIRLRHMVEEGVPGAKLVEKLTEDPNKLLGAILIGNNIVNIAASGLATMLATNMFGPTGVGIATGVMTVLVLIFGEITPKSIAKQRAESVALKVGKPIRLTVIIFKPFVYIFTAISSFFIKILGGDPKASEPFITEEELKTMVGVSEEEGVLENVEKEMIFNVFDFADLQVKDVMVQRVDVSALDSEATYDDVLKLIKEEQFSRIPIYNQTIDDIIGILNVKDLLMLENPRENFKMAKYIREPYYTFEFKKIVELFKEMKKERNHIAVVLDEYGGTVGIITIEDLIEEIVGDIEDEYDDANTSIEVIKDNEYIVDGSVRLHDIGDLIGIDMESDEFDSVGGLIIGELGRMPEEKEEIECDSMKFIVENIDKNRIKKVRIFTDNN